MRQAKALCLVCWLLAAAAPGSTTRAQEIDPDFALQGEYAGTVQVPGRSSQVVGLQVVALGRGKFDAVEYAGGLPGSGWDRATRRKLSGQVENGSAVLVGDGASYVVAANLARSVDQAGRETGRLVKQERRSATLGLWPPPGAIVLFDGRASDELPAAQVTPDGLLLAGVLTRRPVEAFRLHLEFRTPYMPQARGQARGNSGVYIQQRYEVQILDSFGLEGLENECGGLYRQTRPDLNMCLPPLSWQTYDLWFTPPQFAEDGKTKTASARITVLHNGVAIHRHREITAKTGGGKAEAPDPLPINLQDHGNPVMFRNLWLVPGQGDEAYATWQPASARKAYFVQPAAGSRLRWGRCW